MARTKRYWARIQGAMERYTERVGTSVIWFVYNPDDLEMQHDVYDEGGRAWKAGVELPAYASMVEQPVEQILEEGVYQLRRIQLVITPETWRQRGLPDPAAPERVKDRFDFEGIRYSVSHFQLDGRLAGQPTAYRVLAIEVKEDEGYFDPPDENQPYD